ncbi:MAG: FHA domain-containing protein, partial [Clostridia bacterium]|nr:FHA domain-containing protein [Clostridia bacterium]
MSLLVTIRCIKGSLAGKEWRFKDVEEVTIGRMTDNVIVTPEKESMISRHHCIIEINAPLVTVLDFGSKNGTFMNGKLLAKRRSGIPPQEAQKELGDNVLVPSGAVIGVGQTDGTDEIFQVEYREVDEPNEFYNT